MVQIKSYKALIYTSIISFILFIFTFTQIKTNFFGLDTKINAAISTIQTPSLILLSKIISFIFDPITIIIIGIITFLILYFTLKKKYSEMLAIVTIITGLIIYETKNIIGRIRPENLLEKSTSFPSGHATISVVFLGILLFIYLESHKNKVNPQTKKLLYTGSIILVLIVCLSRLILNVHWFSDILGGIFLGMFIVSTSLILKGYVTK